MTKFRRIPAHEYHQREYERVSREHKYELMRLEIIRGTCRDPVQWLIWIVFAMCILTAVLA